MFLPGGGAGRVSSAWASDCRGELVTGWRARNNAAAVASGNELRLLVHVRMPVVIGS